MVIVHSYCTLVFCYENVKMLKICLVIMLTYFFRAKFGGEFPNWNPSQPNITSAYAEATNRGIGNQWVVLDYKE